MKTSLCLAGVSFCVLLLLAAGTSSSRAQTPAPGGGEVTPAPGASPSVADSPTHAQERAAQVATETWLMLLDQGKYGESWQSAASPFQASIAQDKWTSQLSLVRTAYGKASGRKLKVIKYVTTMPGAPQGEYVVLQYEGTFANKKSGVETLTTMLDKDKTWKVAGYFIK